MADQWLYSRDGTDRGPVSSSTLVELAKNGELLPTDLLWKEGMAEWKPASSFPKLFPPQASTDEMPVFVVNDKKPKAGNSTDKTRVRQATSALKAHAQTAGRLAKLTAEKTKIVTVSLPLAYAELGKHRYETRENEQEFSATFEELDAIASAITANSNATLVPQATSFADKAKKVASQGIQLANSQKLALQQKALFARLGKEAYAQQGGQAGPESLVQAIEPLVSRLAKLEMELAENVKKAGGKKRLWMIAGGVVFALIILGGMFGEQDSGGTQTGKSASNSGRRRGSASKPSAVQQIDERIAELEAMLPKAKQKVMDLRKASADHTRSPEERRALPNEMAEAYRRFEEIGREIQRLKSEREAADTRQALNQSPGGSGGGEANNLDGCPRGASAEYKDGYWRMISITKSVDQERKEFRQRIGKAEKVSRSFLEDQLVSGTEKHRVYLQEQLAKAEQACKATPSDFWRGYADGCRYALSNILKRRY
jgi:hypothetical protein